MHASDDKSNCSLPHRAPPIRNTVAERINQTMSKSLEVISEVIQNPKHPFRQVEDQPDKAHKHRYERRKIKEYLKLGDWVAEQQT